MKPTVLSCVIAALWLLSGSPPMASEAVLQPGLFQTLCGRCHDRAGVLVRDSLDVTDGILRARRSGRELSKFLPGHFGRPSPQQVDAVSQALLRIARQQGRFQTRCGICHASAEDLARHELIIVDGTLLGRYSGRKIGAFLERHGTSSAEEAAFFEAVLRRVTESVR